MTSKTDIDYGKRTGKQIYFDALLDLARPTKEDVVLDVGTGKGTAAFFLMDKVKKVYGIDPNDNIILQAKEKLKKEFPHISKGQIEFVALPAEKINERFNENEFDLIVCWASVHHFRDVEEAFRNINRVCKPGGKLVITDQFMPEPIRDFWTMASAIHDPDTIRHYTYNEYIRYLVDNKFTPKCVIPFKAPENLQSWLSSIPGDEYRDMLLKQITGLDETKKKMLSIRKVDEEWEFQYDAFVLMAVKEV